MAMRGAQVELARELPVHADAPPPTGAFHKGRSSASVSPSSLQSITTDPDSLITDQATAAAATTTAPHRQVESPSSEQRRSPIKGPIVIKYNYYDYNGERQDLGQQVATKRVQRQLSPTFKQSLDQIVRSQRLFSERAVNSSSNSSSASPISPVPNGCASENANGEASNGTMRLLARRYQLSSYEQRCLRCGTTVYQMDKVGPLKEFTFYHQNCFKCRTCGTKLTLKTYFNSQHSSADLEVYCHRHCPKTPAGKLDNQSVGIRAALNAPKVFEPGHQQQQMQAFDQQTGEAFHGGHVDSRALHIQHAVQQTRLQSIYKQSRVDQKISQFLNRRLEFLEPKQKMLEMRHREEEEQLFKVFEQKWAQEETQIRDQIRDEWQRELNKLLDKYKRQLSANLDAYNANASNNCPTVSSEPIKLPRIDFHMATGKAPAQVDQREQQMIELERLNLEKTMTIKLDRKKETLKRRLKEFERQATAELVEKQSREMLSLISLKLEEFKQEQKRKIGSDLEHFEAIESLANQLGASLQVANGHSRAPLEAMEPASGITIKQEQQQLAGEMRSPLAVPTPPVSKMELYNSEQPDDLFREVDERAINVAKEDQRSFTELVHALTRHCLTDVEKVRAIFRWITVKNLNTMHFDATVKPDTPLGLLRGIKQGSESYHVLFKRLCSYAGLHCVVIKGFSKSAGYQPGVRFENSRFRNSWNAVFVAGAWRFVQCNWGARHLVSVAVMQDKNSSSSSSNKPPISRTAGRLAAKQLAEQQQLPLASQLGRRAIHAADPLASPHSQQQQQQQQKRRHNQHATAHCDAVASSNFRRAADASALSPLSPVLSQSTGSSSYSTGSSASGSSTAASPCASPGRRRASKSASHGQAETLVAANDSLRYEYDDHYFLTDPDEFIYEFFPAAPEWQLLRSRPLTLSEFEQLPFVRSLFFKYGLYFPQADIKAVLHTNSSGATTIKIGMPTHMIPSLIFHYNLKYFDSDTEQHEGISLKRFVMQSVESGGPPGESLTTQNGGSGGGGEQQMLLANVVSFRVHVPENGAYILDIFANSTTPTQYITGEPMKFKSVCKFKIVARNLKTVMVPLPDCASGEYGPMKATRLFGIIPITHESGLISIQNDKRFLEIQFRMTRPLADFMASLHKNNQDERQLSKLIKIFIDGDIVFITIKFLEDGQYGLDIYTRDQANVVPPPPPPPSSLPPIQNGSQQQSIKAEPKKQLLTHCCKYLINVRAPAAR